MIRLNNLKILALIVVLTDAFSAIHAASYHRSIKTPIEYIVEQDIDAKGIGIGEGDFIQKTFDDENGNKKSLFSFGFAGSTGTALYVLLKNGEQRAALTHYRPMRTSDHLAKIHELAGRLKQDISCDEIAKAVGIIFHEEDWAKNPETGYYNVRVPRDAQLIDRLTEVINEELASDNTLVIQELYSTSISLNKYHPGGTFRDKVVRKDLEIVLSSNPAESYFQTEATYHKKQKLADLHI